MGAYGLKIIKNASAFQQKAEDIFYLIKKV
jgi:hypothetical protein